MFHDIAGHEELTEKIIGCAIRVHDAMRPGLLEAIYERCLAIELRASGLDLERGRRVTLTYRDEPVGLVYIPDLIVNGIVVVEVKAVDRISGVHKTQLITYLKLTSCRVGLLLNFHVESMRAGLKRVVRPDLYQRIRVSP